MKILYIEDEYSIAKPVIQVLESKGFVVDYAKDGQEGLSQGEINPYDCIILDLNLPNIDGIEVAKQLKSGGNTTPILMLTARVSLDNKLEGFTVGTDDYMTKPFEILELIARVNALIRRNSSNSNNTLAIGSFSLFPENNYLLHKENNKKVALSSKECGVLEYLVRNTGRAVSAEELLEHVWDSNIDLFTDTVKTHMKTLRKKLGDQAKYIKTVKGKGYLYEEII